jgi:hypothetical protein
VPCTWSFRAEGLDTPSGFGIEGGGDGAVGLQTIRPLDGEPFVPPKYGVRRLPPATIVADTPGGGGWGNPFARAPGLVLRDVRDGVLNRAAAERDYGVVLAADDLAVDEARTGALRTGTTEFSICGTRAAFKPLHTNRLLQHNSGVRCERGALDMQPLDLARASLDRVVRPCVGLAIGTWASYPLGGPCSGNAISFVQKAGAASCLRWHLTHVPASNRSDAEFVQMHFGGEFVDPSNLGPWSAVNGGRRIG